MLALDYQQENFSDVAWDAIDRGEPFEVVITGKKIKILRKFIVLFLKYEEAKRRRHPSKGLLPLLALYGIWFPTFGSILIHASTWRVNTRLEEMANRLIVSFAPGW